MNKLRKINILSLRLIKKTTPLLYSAGCMLFVFMGVSILVGHEITIHIVRPLWTGHLLLWVGFILLLHYLLRKFISGSIAFYRVSKSAKDAKKFKSLQNRIREAMNV